VAFFVGAGLALGVGLLAGLVTGAFLRRWYRAHNAAHVAVRREFALLTVHAFGDRAVGRQPPSLRVDAGVDAGATGRLRHGLGDRQGAPEAQPDRGLGQKACRASCGHGRFSVDGAMGQATP